MLDEGELMKRTVLPPFMTRVQGDVRFYLPRPTDPFFRMSIYTARRTVLFRHMQDQYRMPRRMLDREVQMEYLKLKSRFVMKEDKEK